VDVVVPLLVVPGLIIFIYQQLKFMRDGRGGYSGMGFSLGIVKFVNLVLEI